MAFASAPGGAPMAVSAKPFVPKQTDAASKIFLELSIEESYIDIHSLTAKIF
jgi:hypothetical protein